MLFGIKKGWLITISVLVLFVFTNPRLNDFKEFRGLSVENNYEEVHKVANFFLFSTYSDYRSNEEVRYIGFLSNFIPLRDREVSLVVTDSTRIATPQEVARAVFITDSLRDKQVDEFGIPRKKN